MDLINLFLGGSVLPRHWNWLPNWKTSTGIRRSQCQIPWNTLHILARSWGPPLQGRGGRIGMPSHILEFGRQHNQGGGEMEVQILALLLISKVTSALASVSQLQSWLMPKTLCVAL